MGSHTHDVGMVRAQHVHAEKRDWETERKGQGAGGGDDALVRGGGRLNKKRTCRVVLMRVCGPLAGLRREAPGTIVLSRDSFPVSAHLPAHRLFSAPITTPSFPVVHHWDNYLTSASGLPNNVWNVPQRLQNSRSSYPSDHSHLVLHRQHHSDNASHSNIVEACYGSLPCRVS
jgi:hypothetical protein